LLTHNCTSIGGRAWGGTTRRGHTGGRVSHGGSRLADTRAQPNHPRAEPSGPTRAAFATAPTTEGGGDCSGRWQIPWVDRHYPHNPVPRRAEPNGAAGTV